MSISPIHLEEEIVVPVCKYLDLYSRAAVNLIMGTIAHESHGGKYLRQIKGPALGICQMEPATHKDIYDNFLKYRPQLRTRLNALCSELNGPTPKEMVSNLKYAVAMCRVHYFRIPHPLPKAHDIPALAAYWKRWYNTPLGAGTEKQFVDAYESEIQ